jgi:hypothetical protein
LLGSVPLVEDNVGPPLHGSKEPSIQRAEN